jgi:hypothetical protein
MTDDIIASFSGTAGGPLIVSEQPHPPQRNLARGSSPGLFATLGRGVNALFSGANRVLEGTVSALDKLAGYADTESGGIVDAAQGVNPAINNAKAFGNRLKSLSLIIAATGDEELARKMFLTGEGFSNLKQVPDRKAVQERGKEVLGIVEGKIKPVPAQSTNNYVPQVGLPGPGLREIP